MAVVMADRTNRGYRLKLQQGSRQWHDMQSTNNHSHSRPMVLRELSLLRELGASLRTFSRRHRRSSSSSPPSHAFLYCVARRRPHPHVGKGRPRRMR
jgi:hypothetical protein